MGLDDVRIEYSDRKTLGLIVERDTSVLVRAPQGTSDKAIEEFLARKRFWLWEKTNHARKYSPQEHQKEFVAGESFLYIGRWYRLEITDTPFAGLRLEHQFVISRSSLDSAKTVFLAWYVAQARLRIAPRVRLFANQMGVAYNEIQILDLRCRWGSCTPKNNLNFNWRLIKAPLYVIDYIIVHELAHLLEPNHTPAFWNVVSVQVPNYERAKNWLAENGGELEMEP